MSLTEVPLDAVQAKVPYAFVGGPFGSNLTAKDYLDDGVPVIRGGNLSADGWFIDDNFVFVSETKADSLRSNTAHAGDLIFTQRGTLGQVGRIPDEPKFPRYIISQSQMKLTVDPDIADSRFIYYYFRQPSIVQEVINRAITSGVPHINLGILRRFKVTLPPVARQRKAADVLCAYDELIENNRRRMQLLEGAARQLYQEWFVRLRFPGCEHTRIANGVPDGWERRSIASLCSSIDYGYTASAEKDTIGPKFLRITDIVPDTINWATVPHCAIADDRIQKFGLREGDIVIARTGATVGYAKRLHRRHPDAVFASYLVRVRLLPEFDNLMIGVFMESAQYKSYVQSRIGGAAQPNANARVLTAAEILLPTSSLQRAFHDAVAPMFDQREILQIQNVQLRNARALLLPRLMSGEITV